MIMVDIQVPSVGRNYNFQLDEQVPVSSLIMEITEMVCQKEGCVLEAEHSDFILCSLDKDKILVSEGSLEQQEILNGERLILI
ncbi:EsaB/YukD family protein [Clostridium sp. CAG:43]|uniref:EsaB/YukD family protein n=1 Tax=Clostridium sp. CAG:43 TaxID=1262805 RepID=UPI000334CFBD|nr:EsaB/YukD family protein [Clostridium sp. CAG:43]CDD59726.1 putative uncharacterized protein [Clostridium sp. CAG:43]